MWIVAIIALAANMSLSTLSQSVEPRSSRPIVGAPASPRADTEIRLDSKGGDIGCTITKSSGSPEQDKRTCDELTKEVEFQSRSGTLPVSDEEDNSWHADIVNLADPAHPTCTSKSKGRSAGSPGCAVVLQRPDLSDIAQHAKQVVFFISVAQGADQPYAGDPEWGMPISNAVTNVYALGASSECVPISFEPGHNPCDKFGTAIKFGDKQREQAKKTTIQETLFALPREP